MYQILFCLNFQIMDRLTRNVYLQPRQAEFGETVDIWNESLRLRNLYIACALRRLVCTVEPHLVNNLFNTLLTCIGALWVRQKGDWTPIITKAYLKDGLNATFKLSETLTYVIAGNLEWNHKILGNFYFFRNITGKWPWRVLNYINSWHM